LKLLITEESSQSRCRGWDFSNSDVLGETTGTCINNFCVNNA